MRFHKVEQILSNIGGLFVPFKNRIVMELLVYPGVRWKWRKSRIFWNVCVI